MKRRFITGVSSFLMTFLLSALISASAVMCFAETFKLDCDPAVVIAACCGAALIAAISMLPRCRWVVVAVEAVEAVLLIAAVRWQWPLLVEGFQNVLFNVTTQYAKDFPVEVSGSAEGDALWFLLVAGVLLAWTAARVCSGTGSAVPVALVCLPVFVSCLLIVDIAPVRWLVLLTGALLLLLLTQSVRAHDPGQGNLLAWLLLAPAAMLISAVLLLSPPEEYVRTDWSDTLREVAEARLGVEEYTGAAPAASANWNRQLSRVNLRWLGPKTLTGDHALDFRATSAISYLRGVSLGIYENNAWSAVDPAAFAAWRFPGQPLVTGSGSAGILEVRTSGLRPQLYTAYHLSAIPDGVTAIDDAYLENSQNATEYSTTYSSAVLLPTGAYDSYVAENYTQLPEELREPLARYIRENGLAGKSVQDIAGHVQSAGVYDLDTARVPAGEDFVLYFLEEGRRGYCVHFASATALLLRSQGIPSRYVTGYSVSGTPGEWTAVTEDEAHAWVEYYQAGIGWRTLDPTPADWRSHTSQLTTESEALEEPHIPEENEDSPTEEPQPEDTTPPAEDAGQEAESAADGMTAAAGEQAGTAMQGAQIRLLRWLLPPLAVLLLIVLRRRLVVRRRRTLCTRQHPNHCLLAYWRWLVRLSEATGKKPDPALLALAEKARFSQHTVREDELAQIRLAVDEEVKTLQASSFVKRIWYQYGRALY